MVINGVAYWTFIQTPNTKFEPCYSVDVEVDSSTSTKLQEAGLKPKMVDGKARFKFKRNVVNKKTGSPNPKPAQLDAAGNPSTVNIGNGSQVAVQIHIRDWKYGGKSGTTTELQGIKVLELVEYNNKPADGEELGAVPTQPTDDELFSE
jgi:hypothetical protein